jgi:hypothetical protein
VRGTWTVGDNTGQLLVRFVAGSRFEVGRKLLGNRYDAFRLQVSSSYREVFDRELRNVLERYGWQIVRFLPRRRTRGPSGVQLATGSLLPRLVQHAPARPIDRADLNV